MNDFIINEFSPITLTVDRVGPFQELPYTIDFTDKDNRPCNFFLLVAANGFGKTTLLECIACVMNLLSQEKPNTYGLEDLDDGEGRIQLDISLRYSWKGENNRVVLSLIAGEIGQDVALKPWGDESLKLVGATSWHRLGFVSNLLKPLISNRSDELVSELLSFIHFYKGRAPDGFNESSIPVPTVLNFSAYRDIPPLAYISDSKAIEAPVRWGYQSAHTFSAHNEKWTYSLDNLLVWLKWLDDGRFEKAQDMLNEDIFTGTNKFFSGVQRDPPQAVIKIDNKKHRLDRLSSGEKSLIQIFLRIASHMTQNTIVLIDEFDAHLHIRWQYKLFNALKKLAAKKDMNLSIIVTSHSTEILDTYINQLGIKEEDGRLIKGGHFIENNLRQEST